MSDIVSEPSRGLAGADWLAGNLNRRDVIVFDSATNVVADADGHEHVVAERAAFEKEHIPGAQFIDLQEQLSDKSSTYNFTLPSARHFEAALRSLGVNEGDTVVLYSSGNPWWATRIWWMFHHFGLDNAYVLDGGLRYWKQRGLPLEAGPGRARAAGNIAVKADRALTIDAETLRSRLNEPGLALVNALSPDKFSGRTRVHGGRPGHIPGSVNLPAASLLDPDTGLFKPSEAIRGTLEEQGLLAQDKEVVAYCGGGVSATQVILALHRAGQDKVKLYDASLSEWAHRDGFPLETTEPLDEK